MTEEPPVVVRREGHAAHLVLNRPRAINALNQEMVDLIGPALAEWAVDDSVATVVLTGAGERGLCAGGDVVALWRSRSAEAAARFWSEEYRLNAAIAHYPKPYVAVMDGLVLGGGVGLSAHAGIRVVTERSRVGMPETTIGFVPDVGGTYLLARAPGETGTHLALTAGTADGADAVALGLADHYVPSDRLPGLIAALAQTDATTAVARFAEEPPASTLLADREWIDACYAGEDAETILDRLRATGHAETAAVIAAKSPTSVTATLRALRIARGLATLEESLALEYRIGRRLFLTHDFAEGIRAQLVDKDRNPRWDPPTLADVGSLDALFEPLPDELDLP